MSTYSPEVALARAVIVDAIDTCARGRSETKAHEEATAFLFDTAGPWANSRRYWCGLALLSESALVAKLSAAIDKARSRGKNAISDALSAA